VETVYVLHRRYVIICLRRISWIAALKESTLLLPITFVGACNRDLFEVGLVPCLLPQLQPGNVIVRDNATFHHGPAIKARVAQAGCEMGYVPSYSPDLNQIEHGWFVLKNWMRQPWSEFDSLRDCVDAAFKACLNVAS
jgi:transposase